MSDRFLVSKRPTTNGTSASKKRRKNMTSLAPRSSKKTTRTNQVPPTKSIIIDDVASSASSSAESDSNAEDAFLEDAMDAEDRETAQEKRLRLAKRYIETMQESLTVQGGFDAEDIDKQLLNERLRDEAVREMFLKDVYRLCV